MTKVFLQYGAILIMGMWLTGCTSFLEPRDHGSPCKIDADCDDEKYCHDGWCLSEETGGFECGNGVVEPGERCDGNCPSLCNDGNSCTTDVRTGAEDTCSTYCQYSPIEGCSGDDGCCPAGCTWETDPDCSNSCGNGIVEDNETCDGEDCPLTCSDGNSCTDDLLTGSAETCSALCSFSPVIQCENEDGCCPAGCTTLNDADCSPLCGNGVVDEGGDLRRELSEELRG